MTYPAPHHLDHSLTDLVAALDEYSQLCQFDYDDGLDELERQFAELRLTFDNH